jgi:hypothetical protein
MGPTTKAITVTGGVTFPQLVENFYQQASALVAGGADILLVETCQDTRNVKAALLAIDRLRVLSWAGAFPPWSRAPSSHGHHARGADGGRLLRFGGARRPAFHWPQLRYRAGVHDRPHTHHQ